MTHADTQDDIRASEGNHVDFPTGGSLNQESKDPQITDSTNDDLGTKRRTMQKNSNATKGHIPGGQQTTDTGTDTSRNTTRTTSLRLSVETLNCMGFKQNSDYISNRMKKNDVMCLSETWCRPNELDIINDALKHSDPDSKFSVFAKSGMTDEVPDYLGRPYGGVAVICRHRNKLNFQMLDSESDRVVPVAISSKSGRTIQIVVSVYLPYYDGGNGKQTELLLSTIDALQVIIDSYGHLAPINLCGDFNVQLPVAETLDGRWYKRRPYNEHSKIVYDFLLANELVAVDLGGNQDVNYTYFNHKRRVYTWIDHIVTNSYNVSNVSFCKIVPEECSNLGDHLPVRMECFVESDQHGGLDPGVNCNTQSFKFPDWSRSASNERYCDTLKQKLELLPVLSIPSHLDRESEIAAVNEYLNSISNLLLSSTEEAGCLKRPGFKPKPYWSPDLTKIRDQKKFWWSLWVECGRPRSGELFKSYKGVKKQYRKVLRNHFNSSLQSKYARMDDNLAQGRLNRFWNAIKRNRRQKLDSNLCAEDFGTFYSGIMNDDSSDTLTDFQLKVKQTVETRFSNQVKSHLKSPGSCCEVSTDMVNKAIGKLKVNKAAGYDQITTEHLLYGRCDGLLRHLAALYTIMFQRTIVPDAFHTGLIIPILKKSTLDKNVTGNYRPVTLSSVFSKLAEIFMTPDCESLIAENQFGFQPKRGTDFCTNILNDVIAHAKSQNYPLFICGLDAEKCFDKIWHSGLLFKLIDVLPVSHWLFMYKWYRSLNARVRFNGLDSCQFEVTCGTRQGSLLSPLFFNVFINDLLSDLSTLSGIRIGPVDINSVGFADDITLVHNNVLGLQCLIDRCHEYAKKWRFTFGIVKSKCMVLGKNPFISCPIWTLGNNELTNVNNLEILGTVYNNKGDASLHVEKNISKCRRSFFSLNNSGLCYPGLGSRSKAHLWRTICVPSLLNGIASSPLNDKQLEKLESTQGTLVKKFLGLGKHQRHSKLLQALNIPRMSMEINARRLSLARRICMVRSPARHLHLYNLSKYMLKGETVNGTLIDQIVKAGYSPFLATFYRLPVNKLEYKECGMVDSLRGLLSDSNYNRRNSLQYHLVRLLTRY